MIRCDETGVADPPPETADELYHLAPCGYLTTQVDGTITRVNATLLVLLQETSDSLIGRPFQTILTKDACILHEMHCAPLLLTNGLLKNVSLDLLCAGGARLPALLTWRRVADQQGRLLGYRISATATSEHAGSDPELQERVRSLEAMLREVNANLDRRVEARTAELVQAQKMESLGKLTGGVAHDFNNLLTPILITLDLLQNRFLTDERALRMVASAVSAAERGRVLISRLLAFARRQHLRPQAVDLAQMTDGMRCLIEQTVGPRISVRVAMPDGLPPARVDEKQLEIALLNLCVNARDAMPHGGGLTIAADTVTIGADADGHLPHGGYLRLAVSDTGGGMDEQTLRRAAEPFYSTKAVGKGTGLGLSMVYGLAAQSGGKLTLESSHGCGTKATIWLPVDPDAVPPPAAPALLSNATAPRKLSILLVDDDDLVRFATGEMLVDLGHTAIQAASGPEALELLRQHASVDLLITDYSMPGMTGVELARLVHVAQADLPVVLVTGYASFKNVDGGGLPRLAKPFSTHDLSAIIDQTLAAVTRGSLV